MDDMSAARPFALPLLVAALAFCNPSGAASSRASASIAPAQDMSLPLWCEWGYDWPSGATATTVPSGP